MKKQLITLIGAILALTSIPLHGQSLLWKITGNGLNSPSYLFGTIHMVCENYELSAEVLQAINQSEQVYLELDTDDPSFQTKIMQLSMNADMKNISDSISESDKKKLNEFLKTHYNATLEQLGVLKPFALMGMILIKRIPCENQTSIEQLIQNQTDSSQKSINGLETVEYQMGLFDQVPIKDQLIWIMDLLDDAYLAEFQNLTAAYTTENLKELNKLIAESPGMDNYLDLLLYQRNSNWVPQISEISKAKSTFYGVGAGHLAGPKGLIALLQKEGFTVSPIN